MEDAWIIFVAVLVLIIIFIWFRSSTHQTGLVTMADLPALISELKQKGSDGSFVVFMFNTPDNTDQTLPNIQYSIENDRLGFDWVLLAPSNIRDEEKITQWIRNSGFAISKHTMNGVSYLRSEDEGIENIGSKLIRDFYKLSPDTKLEVIREGF